MDQNRPPPSRWETIGIGAIAAMIGLYLVLVALSLLPPPSRANGPMWVVLLVGLCFLLGGLGALIPVVVTGEVRSDGELPAGAPSWLRLAQHMFMLAIFTCFAMIGSWIAFGPGTRSFSVSLPFVSIKGAAELIGRALFGLGAVITWLCVILVAVNGWRKLRGRDQA